MHLSHNRWLALLVAVAGSLSAGDARADGRKNLAADLARLDKEVAELRAQNQLLLRLLQVERERSDSLFKLLSGQGPAPLAGAAAPPTAGLPVPAGPGPVAAASGPGSAATPAAPDPAGAPSTSPSTSTAAGPAAGAEGAALSGKVTVKGGSAADAYVFVENVRASMVRGKAIEIKQEGKQFSPRVAVVQRGTRVTFPNNDAVYHNVFSTSEGNAFDLGAYRAGDPPKSVTLTAAGAVDVFCNMHAKMSAAILVVPNGHWTRVASDGTFRLEGVPQGSRKIVGWAPHAKPVHRRVEVGPAGAEVNLSLDVSTEAAHVNKLGQPYGSYKD